MPVNWLWKHHMGHLVQVQTHTVDDGVDIFGNKKTKTVVRKFRIDIYSGSNCLAVFTYEFKEESDNPKDVDPKTGKRKIIPKYTFCGFWNDKKHMENMLGMHPKQGYADNCYSQKDNPDDYVEKFYLNTYYKEECKEILSCAQEWAKSGVKIILYYKEPKKDKKGAK